jgi:hypothetical protein
LSGLRHGVMRFTARRLFGTGFFVFSVVIRGLLAKPPGSKDPRFSKCVPFGNSTTGTDVLNPRFDYHDQRHWSKHRMDVFTATFKEFIEAIDSSIPIATLWAAPRVSWSRRSPNRVQPSMESARRFIQSELGHIDRRNLPIRRLVVVVSAIQ